MNTLIVPIKRAKIEYYIIENGNLIEASEFNKSIKNGIKLFYRERLNEMVDDISSQLQSKVDMAATVLGFDIDDNYLYIDLMTDEDDDTDILDDDYIEFFDKYFYYSKDLEDYIFNVPFKGYRIYFDSIYTG